MKSYFKDPERPAPHEILGAVRATQQLALKRMEPPALDIVVEQHPTPISLVRLNEALGQVMITVEQAHKQAYLGVIADIIKVAVGEGYDLTTAPTLEMIEPLPEEVVRASEADGRSRTIRRFGEFQDLLSQRLDGELIGELVPSEKRLSVYALTTDLIGNPKPAGLIAEVYPHHVIVPLAASVTAKDVPAILLEGVRTYYEERVPHALKMPPTPDRYASLLEP